MKNALVTTIRISALVYEKLKYLAQIYGSQAAAIRAAIINEYHRLNPP